MRSGPEPAHHHDGLPLPGDRLFARPVEQEAETTGHYQPVVVVAVFHIVLLCVCAQPGHCDEEDHSENEVPMVGEGAWVELGAEDEEEEGLEEDRKQLHSARRQAAGLRTESKT